MPILPALMALAQFAPSIMRFIGVGETPTKVSEVIAQVASQVSGSTSVEDAISVFSQNAEKAQEFRLKMQDMDMQLQQMYLADVQNARDRDAVFIKAGYFNHRANAMFVLALVVIVFLLYIVWTTPDLNEYAKGILTLILGQFLQFLSKIYDFEFGTTRSEQKAKSLEEKK